jgi:hypothetical protein
MRLLGAVLVLLAVVPWLGMSIATADGPQTIHVKAASIADHECNDTEWHFIINQIDVEANAPTSIHVTFSDGAVDVTREKFTGGAAHYTELGHLDATVVDATAVIYEGWSGQFVVSHGPCGTSETTPPVTTTPPGSTPPETTPVETTPVETTPVETTPVETTPVETTPEETTPAETTPGSSVLPTKIGSTGETSVLGTKVGALAETGMNLPIGAAFGLSLGLLLAGGSLMALPGRLAVERKRRH